MARKKPPTRSQQPPTQSEPSNGVQDVRILRTSGAIMLLGEPASAGEARAALSRACHAVAVLRKLPELLEASSACDVLVVCAQHDSPQVREALDVVRRQRPGVACVLWCDEPTMDLAGYCLRVGLADLIDAKAAASRPEDTTQRLTRATQRTRQWRSSRRARASKAKELRETSKQLAALQHELEKQVGAFAGQLAGSFRDVAGQLKYVAIATELETLLRQDLEVEPLLRTTLEFLLRKVGAVNAAIFMPDDSGDYSLGAYVNYDFPRETAQATLEELCDTLAPLFDSKAGLHVVHDAGSLPTREDQELGQVGGPPMGWLRDATLGVFACPGLAKGAPSAAMLTIFRDKATPFDPSSLRLLSIIGEHFGQQLHRLIRTSNRAAKHNWDASGDARGEAA